MTILWWSYIHVVKIKLLMLFICLCGVFNMQIHKSAPLLSIFLLKTAVNQRQSPKHSLKSLVLYILDCSKFAAWNLTLGSKLYSTVQTEQSPPSSIDGFVNYNGNGLFLTSCHVTHVRCKHSLTVLYIYR